MSLKTNSVSSGYSTGVINSNFKKIEEYVNDNLLNRDGVTPGEPNQMEVDLDMNSQDILNVGKIDAKEIDLDGIPIEELLGNTVGEATQEANRAKQEADRAKQEADSIAGALDTKVDKVVGMGLSSNDFTDPLREKLIGIESGAQVNTVTSVNSRTGAVAGLVEDTDPRLTDAREWSAATVTQAEAEAGTGTIRRAWTAQRVRQAIAAWWNTIGTAFGKTLLGSADAAAARGSLGLGTAATRNVGTSNDQVPEFVSNGEGLGGFGYGRVGTSVGQYTDVNDVPKRTGFYLLTEGHPNSTNNKAPLAGFYDTCIVRTLRQGPDEFVDVYLPHPNYSPGMVIAPHTSSGYATQRIVSDSVNLRTSTGNSTIYPMSQKAVTDALNTKIGLSEVNVQTSTAYTLVLTDAFKMVVMDNAGTNTLTVPPNSAVAFPANTRIDLGQDGAGQTTIVAGAGVTIRTPETLKLRKQWSKASLIRRAANVWDIVGDMEAAT